MPTENNLDISGSYPQGFSGVNYIDFLASISRKRETVNYLEIGVHFGHTLCRIGCRTAVGVDPNFMLSEDVTRDKHRTVLMRATSDRFFSENDVLALYGGKIDLAFLDGLHQFEVLLRDFYNTEANSTKNGLIVMHDCLPLNFEMTTRNSEAVRHDVHKGMWTGDVWKLIPILRHYRPDLDVVLVDCPPTGLVCVTGLDPNSRVLSENYRQIVQEYRNTQNDPAQILQIYDKEKIMNSVEILNAFDHSLYFKI